jgi:hypothetical protein
MRINSDPPHIVVPPEVRPEVGGVGGTRAVAPIGAQPAAGTAAPPAGPAAAERPPVNPAPTAIERRATARRGEDRRKQQVRVLVDMRVSQRRRQRRRDEDAPPPSIDVKA